MMLRRLLIFAVATTLFLGCDKKEDATTAPKPTTAAQAEPTPAPSEAVKLTVAIQPHDNPEKLKAHADELAKFLADETGYEIDVIVPTDYGDEIEAMRKGKAQLALYSGWAYLKAHMTADADLLLAETIDGKPSFRSRWYRAKDAKIGDLADLRGKRVAFTSPSSPAGFLFPYAQLIRKDVVKQGEDLNKAFKDVFFAGTDEAALMTLVEGKADAAAASDRAYDKGLTDEQKAGIEVLSEQEAAPTRVFAVRADMKMEVRDKLKAALLELNKDEHRKLREDALGIEGLVERSHGDHVTGLSEAQELVGTEFPLPRSE